MFNPTITKVDLNKIKCGYSTHESCFNSLSNDNKTLISFIKECIKQDSENKEFERMYFAHRLAFNLFTDENRIRFAIYCAEMSKAKYEQTNLPEKSINNAIYCAENVLKNNSKHNRDKAYNAYMKCQEKFEKFAGDFHDISPVFILKAGISALQAYNPKDITNQIILTTDNAADLKQMVEYSITLFENQ